MAVVRWHPTMPWRPFQQPWSSFEGLESLRNEMDRLFDSFAGSTQPSGIRESVWTPRVDLLEHEQAFVLVADLPGMKQEDISVSVQDNGLCRKFAFKTICAMVSPGTLRWTEREDDDGD